MKIYLASDHGGFEYKEELEKFFFARGHEVEDIGPHQLNPNDDYPDFIIPCAEKVSKERALRQVQGKEVFGIVLGRSGNGEAIAANKVRGVRAVLCLNEEMARLAREHNNANILSIGADLIGLEMAKRVADVFIKTSFSEKERHERRIKKIADYESSETR